jgi:rod shape-determining protein MreD
MFVLAVYYALWGPWPDAAIAAWLLGLLVGAMTADRIGLHAFCFGGAAWAILRIRQVLFRDHPITQFAVTFAFALVVQLIVGVYRAWQAPASGAGDGWAASAVLIAAYTAVWAPLLHWALIRLRRWTGLHARQSLSPSR